MVDLKYCFAPYIDEVKFYELLNKASEAEYLKSGGNSKCAIIDDYAVIKTGNIPGHDDMFEKIIEALHGLRENGINVVPIYGYAVVQFGKPYASGKRYDKGYIVQQKAPGKELLYPKDLYGKSDEERRAIVMDYLNVIHSIPQSHYDKWVSDLKCITDNKIMVDPSKETNFFYDSTQGFSFIDLNFFTEDSLFDMPDSDGQKHHAEFILYTLTPFRRLLYGQYDKHLQTPEDLKFSKEVISESLSKYMSALKKLGVTEKDIDYAFQIFNIPAPQSKQVAEPERSQE